MLTKPLTHDKFETNRNLINLVQLLSSREWERLNLALKPVYEIYFLFLVT